MGELTILNREGKKISVLIEKVIPSKGLTILTHGLGGDKNTPILKTISKIFNSKGYTTLRFDTRNTYGKSEGTFEDATITSYHEDLEDIINWAKKQNWYKEPFVLVGHSIGGSCSGLVAENSPSKVKALALISSVVSGELSSENYPLPLLDNWEKQGFFEWNDGKRTKRLKWNFILDSGNYNLLKRADSLTMPTLIISGENDTDTPTRHHKLLYDKLPGPKEIRIIKNGEHDLDKPENLKEIEDHIKNWINNLPPSL